MRIAYSASVAPPARLLRRSANAEDRPARFAAQFAHSHMCWLICHPLVGQLGARVGMAAAFGGMAVIAAIGVTQDGHSHERHPVKHALRWQTPPAPYAQTAVTERDGWGNKPLRTLNGSPDGLRRED